MTASQQIISTNFKDSFADSVDEAMERIFKGATEAEKESWLRANADELRTEIESFLPEAIARVKSPQANPKGPVLHFKRPEGGEINLWVYEAGQPCAVGEHRQFHFGCSQTAGLVYVEKGPFGHHAVEHNIDNASTWEWIQKIMDAGMLALYPATEKEVA